MIHVQIPEFHQPEVHYVFFVLFRHWLKVPYQVFIDKANSNYVLKGSEGEIEIRNVFFRESEEPLFYLRRSCLPLEARWIDTPIGRLPVLYGEPVLEFHGKRVILGSDLVATLFFFLTRWEEYLEGEVDEHGRFPAARAWSVQQGLIHVPIVNGYLELLKVLLTKIGFSSFSKSFFRLELTFDIDHPFLFKGNILDLRKVIRYLFLEGDLTKAYHTFLSYCKGRDPYWEILKEIVGQVPSSTIFYFLVGRHSRYDHFFPLDREEKRQVVDLLRSKGVMIGLHPSYRVMEKPSLLFQEKEELESLTGQTVEHVRFHYLRFQVPWIWNVIQKAKIGYDSSFIYSRCNGFRCGTGNSFPVFHCLKRRLLPIIEIPPIFMPLPDQDNLAEEFFLLLNQCRKWGTPMRILFHPSALFESVRIRELYELVLKEMG